MVEMNDKVVVLEKQDYDNLMNRIDRIEKMVSSPVTNTLFQSRVARLSNGGMLDTNAICELMGWSRRTFSRRLEAGEIPVVQDGRKYKMAVDDFISWHSKNYRV